MAWRCRRFLSNVEVVAPKAREFGIKVNIDLENILQSSVLTSGALDKKTNPNPKMLPIESATTGNNVVVVNLPPDEEARRGKEDEDKHYGEDKYEDDNEEESSADEDNSMEEDRQEDQTSDSSENNNQSKDIQSVDEDE